MGKPYYKTAQGLRFACTQCGNCCTRPGPVYFTGDDLPRAADFLGLTSAQFTHRYRVYRDQGQNALDPGPDRPCPFYDGAVGCTIYPARPTQCRTWPFWPEVVNQKRSWNRAAKDCPGMNRGPLRSPAQIEREIQRCQDMDLPDGDPW